MTPKLTLLLFQYAATVPLSAAYLAYGLKKVKIGFEVSLCDPGNFKNLHARLFRLMKKSGDIIAIGCYSDTLPYALAALKRLKREYPGKTVILGGIGPSMVAKEILEGFDCVDYVIRGCGIIALPELFLAITEKRKQFGAIRGLAYREKGRVIANSAGNSCENIPRLPEYSAINNISGFKLFLVKTSSGCPYRCAFCCVSSVYDRKVVNRDLKTVLAELRLIKKIKGPGAFVLRIIDEGFILNRKRVLEFCSLLRRSRLRIPWMCYGRVDRMDEELLKTMARAGCIEIFYGVESGSNSILKKIRKGFTIEAAVKMLLLSKKYIPGVVASFIYRYPFETMKDFMETWFYMLYLKHNSIFVQLHPLAPVKNSEIYRNYSGRLRFSKNEQGNYLGRSLADSLPGECLELIKEQPRVFYDYWYYYSRDLAKVNRFIRKHKKIIYGNCVPTSWVSNGIPSRRKRGN